MSLVGQNTRNGEHGQTLVLILLVICALCVMTLAVVDVGNAVYEKIKLQDAADAAVYSSAVWEARFMNFAAYANRAMVANLVTTSEFVTLISSAYFIADILRKITGADYTHMVEQLAKTLGSAILLIQEANEMLSDAQLTFFEQVKLIAPQELEAIAKANDPDAKVNEISDMKFLKYTVMGENFYSFVGSSAVNRQEKTRFKRFIHPDHPYDKGRRLMRYDATQKEEVWNVMGDGKEIGGMVAGAMPEIDSGMLQDPVTKCLFQPDFYVNPDGNKDIMECLTSSYFFDGISLGFSSPVRAAYEYDHNARSKVYSYRDDIDAREKLSLQVNPCVFVDCWQTIFSVAKSHSSAKKVTKELRWGQKKYEGIPNFIQLEDDVSDQASKDLPSVFVVLSKRFKLLEEIEKIAQGLKQSDSPVVHPYSPSGMAGHQYIALARAMVDYRGTQEAGHNDHALAQKNRPSLFQPFWKARLYPFHGQLKEHDPLQSRLKKGYSVQENIIQKMPPWVITPDTKYWLNKKNEARMIRH